MYRSYGVLPSRETRIFKREQRVTCNRIWQNWQVQLLSSTRILICNPAPEPAAARLRVGSVIFQAWAQEEARIAADLRAKEEARLAEEARLHSAPEDCQFCQIRLHVTLCSLFKDASLARWEPP